LTKAELAVAIITVIEFIMTVSEIEILAAAVTDNGRRLTVALIDYPADKEIRHEGWA
jgi:hypothetical protein